MKTLEKLNKEWKTLFEKKRLKLVTSKSTELVDLLQHGKVTSILWMDTQSHHQDWEVTVAHDSDLYAFQNFEDGEFEDLSEFFNDPEQAYDFFEFLDELDIPKHLHLLRTEELEVKLEKANQEHLNQKIVKIENHFGMILYHLENGEKIYVDL